MNKSHRYKQNHNEEEHEHKDIQEPKIVTMRESAKFLCDGTTALRTWSAAKHLCCYFGKNRTILNNKVILELGCGTGFVGICTYLLCDSPRKIIMTDVNPASLALVQNNIRINVAALYNKLGQLYQRRQQYDVGGGRDFKLLTLDEIDNLDVETVAGYISQLNEEALCTQHLDWLNVSENALLNLNVDVVLASDVVFDVEIIPALCNVLDVLLSNRLRRIGNDNGNNSDVEREQVIAYVAFELRNEITFKSFTSELEKRFISVEIISVNDCDGEGSIDFYYDCTAECGLLKLSKINTTVQ